MAMSDGNLTRVLAEFIAGTEETSIPESAYEHGKVAFMDWIAVTIGGKDDPLVAKLIRYAGRLGGEEQATIIGHGMRKNVSMAALINGSASHVLDYDDTLVSFFGHPSVTLFPSLLALSEWLGKSGREFLTAYLIGLQAGATVGVCAGLDHYMAGWHATATLGHIASAAGCARLLGLDEDQSVHALGIGGTQSSGLKRVFGTMCKPFHAGMSSQGGLTAALLAADGFTSAEDILEGPQGFFQVLKGAVNADAVGLLGLGWDVQNLSQKYHASCHATHSPIEAALAAMAAWGGSVDDIGAIRVHSSELALSAAGKTNPLSGLEGKFSIPYCVANALIRGETGTRMFTDEKVADQAVRSLMEKISVSRDPAMIGLESRVEVETNTGTVYEKYSDILQETPPLETKRQRVMGKFNDLCEPLLGAKRAARVAGAVSAIEQVKNMRILTQEL